MERLTLIGLYNYDNSLFDSCTLPTGIDKDLTIDCILNRGGQFETIYPDFDYLKYSMGKWFERHYRTFDKWITALNIEYDPLNNYDRYEESIDNRAYSDNESGAHNQINSHNQTNSHNQVNSHNEINSLTEDNSHNEVGSSNLSESNSNSQKSNSSSATNGATAGTQGNTVTNTVSAFDSGNFQNKDQQTSNGSDSSTTSGNTVTNNLTDENGERTNSSNDIRNSNDNKTANNNSTSNDSLNAKDNINANESLSGNNQLNKNGIDKNQHSAHLYGNIGVTTSQQMLQSELDIARFNIYNEIAELFIEDFCILVY